MIPEKESRKRWVMYFYDNDIFQKTDEELRALPLPQDFKSQFVKEFEDFCKNENTQNLDESLINIRNLQFLPMSIFTHWIMDRLKEAMKQYIEGQWFSSISLCGALVESVATQLCQASADKFHRKPPKFIKKRLAALHRESVISAKKYYLLDCVRALRDKHLHLRMLSRDKDKLKNGNLIVLTNLFEYLSSGSSWQKIMSSDS